jgi:hypothetical protein
MLLPHSTAVLVSILLINCAASCFAAETCEDSSGGGSPPVLQLHSRASLEDGCLARRAVCVIAVLPQPAAWQDRADAAASVAEHDRHVRDLELLAQRQPSLPSSVGFLWMHEGAQLGIETALGGPFDTADGPVLVAYQPAEAAVSRMSM